MDTLLAIVGIVFAFLQIILFFKLWGMTNNISRMANDIKEIKKKYLGKHIVEKIVINNESSLDGKLVVNLSTEKQMRVNGLTEDGKYKCYVNHVFVGNFSDSEIIDFDEWENPTQQTNEYNTPVGLYILVGIGVVLIIGIIVSLFLR